MTELSARIAAPAIVRTAGNGNDPRQAAMGLFYGTQTAEPFTLQEAITVYYDPGTGLTGDPIPALNQARLWQGDQASTDSANLALLNNLTTFYTVFTLPGSLQLYAAAQQDYPGITDTTIPLWGVSGRHWRRAQLRAVVVPVAATFPRAVCVVNDGTQDVAWVTTANGTIDRYNLDGTPYSGGPLALDPASAPFGIAVIGPEVWVCDNGEANVWRFAAAGTLLGTFPYSGLGFPIWIGEFGGAAWVASSADSLLERFTTAAVYIDTLSGNHLGAGQAHLLEVSGLVWTMSVGLPHIGTWNPTTALPGTSVTTFISAPSCICLVGSLLWVGDFSDNTIKTMHADGSSAGTTIATFATTPFSIGVVGSQIWVAVTGDMYIHRFNPDGSSAGAPIPVT